MNRLLKVSILVLFFLVYALNNIFAQDWSAWKNYWVEWKSTGTDTEKWCRNMEIDGFRIGGYLSNYYKNNPLSKNKGFWLSDPEWYGQMYVTLPNVSQMTQIRNYDPSYNYSQAQKDWYSDRMLVNNTGTTTWPNMHVTGYFSNQNLWSFMPCWQSASVRNEWITNIMNFISTYVSNPGDVGHPFDFRGFQFDVPDLYGGFFVWTDAPHRSSLTDQCGTESCQSGTHTHDKASYQDGLAQFYKDLMSTVKAVYPNAKWVIDPARIYDTTGVYDEYVYGVSSRSDKVALTPDLIMQEGANLEPINKFATYSNLGMPIRWDMIGIEQRSDSDMVDYIAYAALCAKYGAWHHPHWGNLGGLGNMPAFAAISNIYSWMKTIANISNWDNLVGLGTASRNYTGTQSTNTYWSTGTNTDAPHVYFDDNVMYGRFPSSEKKMLVCFVPDAGTTTLSGSVTVHADEVVSEIYNLDGLFGTTTSALNDFNIVGNNIIPKTSVVGTSSGNAYMVTLGEKLAAITLSGSGQMQLSGGGRLVPAPLVFVYGCAWNADGLTLQQLGQENGRAVSYRFRANYSGNVYGVQIYLIFKALGYYEGNGGQVLLQLQTDDGTVNHFPSGTVLTSSLITDPMITDPVEQWNRFFAFGSPVQLQKGVLYHLVFTNPAPDPINNWVSLDLLWNSKGTPNMQPGISDTDLACVWKKNSTRNWSMYYYATPIYSLYYNDGTFQGQGYIEAWVNAPVSISGENKVRETFTVSGTNRTVSKVSVRLKKSGSPGDLTVRLEYSNGTLIEEGTIPASSISTSYDWVTYTFENERTLESGKSYNLVLSAPVGDSYSIYVLGKGGITTGFDCPEIYKDGDFQMTSGSQWVKFNIESQTRYDMQFYFTKTATTPRGSLTINGGIVYTKTTSVTLNLSATDDAGVTGYYLSISSAVPSATAAGWTSIAATTSYNANVPYTLSSGDGTKTIYVWYKDAAGNVSATASDAIILDTTAPAITITSPTSNATYSTTSSTINLGGNASDVTSGVSVITWSSDRGGSGTASGTTSWSIASIALSSDSNIITVTATDMVGNNSTDKITVTYNNSTPYGCAWNADGLTSMQIGQETGRAVSYRFRANQAGSVYGVQVYLGTYTGNGGQVLLQLQTDDGTANHFPSGTVFASSLVTDPMNQWNRFFPFDAPVQLQKGALYHLVFTNPVPDPINNWVSLKLLYNIKGTPNMQPGISDTDLACIWRKNSTSDWSMYYYATPIYSLYYNDGTFQGQGYIEAWVNAPVSISGENKVRETFTVSGTNRTVSKVLVRLNKSGSPGDLTVRLEYSNGALIEEGTVPASLISSSYDWVTYAFKDAGVLESGRSYNLVLSAPPGDSYSTYALGKGGITTGFDCPEIYKDGHFQITSNSQWVDFRDDTKYDMQFYFKE